MKSVHAEIGKQAEAAAKKGQADRLVVSRVYWSLIANILHSINHFHMIIIILILSIYQELVN